MTLEQRREQARANLEAVRAARQRRARERLAAIERARERRTMRPALPAERRLRELCWAALVKLHADGLIPQTMLDERPGLAEALTAAARY